MVVVHLIPDPVDLDNYSISGYIFTCNQAPPVDRIGDCDGFVDKSVRFDPFNQFTLLLMHFSHTYWAECGDAGPIPLVKQLFIT